MADDTTEHALDRDYFWNGDLHEASDQPKEVPTALAERDKALSGEDDTGIPSPFETENGLPTALPAKAKSILEDAGVDEWDRLLALVDNDGLEEIDGIGPSRAENVRRAVDEIKQYHAPDEDDEQ